MRALAFILLAACTTEPEPQLYSCVVLYRCAGDATITAALALPCAVDLDEANALAVDAGIEAAACTWQYMRPICEMYAPATTCTESEP